MQTKLIVVNSKNAHDRDFPTCYRQRECIIEKKNTKTGKAVASKESILIIVSYSITFAARA